MKMTKHLNYLRIHTPKPIFITLVAYNNISLNSYDLDLGRQTECCSEFTEIKTVPDCCEFMIPNQWYAILESNEIKKRKTTSVTRMGEKMAAWRNAKGDLDVIEDKCPYRGLPSVWAR
jgi:hypothetical protein